MTSREDLLDQYIDALNTGSVDDLDVSDDPEVRALLQTAQRVKAEASIEWPEFDLPAEMSQTLAQQLNPAAARARAADEPIEEPEESHPVTPIGATRGSDEDEQGGWRWYTRQFAGMAAAAAVVGLFALGLAYILGDWGGEVHAPGTAVEEGQIPGTILYVEHHGRFLEDEANQTIARIEADGTNQQELASRPVSTADRAGFAWSPDGQWVAYTDPESGSRDAPTIIGLVSADGTETETIDMEPLEGVMRLNAALTWADDGNHIALVHLDPELEQHRIAVVHQPTGETSHVTEADETQGGQSHPAWMPGELTLAFSQSDAAGQYRIVVTDGVAPPETIAEDEDRAIQPTWSPDAGWLAYVGSSEDGTRGNVHVLNLRSGETENITGHDERFDYMPTWSSRGQIAFMSDFGDMEYDIFVVNPDGSELRNLTEDVEWHANIPDWSDDGRYLTFTTVSPDQDRWRINVYDIDEDRLYTVHESENPLFYAQWRPDVADEDQAEPDLPDDADISVDKPSDELLALMRQSAERYISDVDDPVALTVNGQEITAGQVTASEATAELSRITMQDMVDDQEGRHPEMVAYNQALVDLVDEYGPENTGLGRALVDAAIRDYAEANDLVATEAQIEEAMERQRESHEMIEQQDPEAAAAVSEAQIEVIGEERYWEEYLPRALTSGITETNVAEAIWQSADVVLADEDPNRFGIMRELVLAEFHADLVRSAEIEVVDDSALEGADLDRAVEYITEAYPMMHRERLDRQDDLDAQPGGAARPAVDEGGLQSETDVESYMQEVFEVREYPSAEILDISQVTYGEMRQEQYSTTSVMDPDAPVWRVETQGFIPGPLSMPMAIDGEPPDVPEPGDVNAIVWIDPDTGLLSSFTLQDSIR